jgi:hypothetical protein
VDSAEVLGLKEEGIEASEMAVLFDCLQSMPLQLNSQTGIRFKLFVVGVL